MLTLIGHNTVYIDGSQYIPVVIKVWLEVRALIAESDVYCDVVMNVDEVNISNKTLFTSTYYLIS